jgi:hypothetical protein
MSSSTPEEDSEDENSYFGEDESVCDSGASEGSESSEDDFIPDKNADGDEELEIIPTTPPGDLNIIIEEQEEEEGGEGKSKSGDDEVIKKTENKDLQKETGYCINTRHKRRSVTPPPTPESNSKVIFSPLSSSHHPLEEKRICHQNM